MPLLPRGPGGGGGTSDHNELQGLQGGSDALDEFYHLTKKQLDSLGMKYYRGVFPDENALRAAHPTDVQGAYAVILTTETFWVWTDDWTDTGHNMSDMGVPPGGTSGQVLAKRSDADGDIEWRDESGGEGGGHIIEDESGATMPQRPVLQFVDMDVRDDPDNYRTIVGLSTRPQKPQNLSPADGDINVEARPLFTSSPYVCLLGTAMYGYQIRIFDVNDTIVYDSGNLETESVQFRIPEGILLESTLYKWQVRYQSSALVWSIWSDLTVFTTSADFSDYIQTPGILLPANGDVLNAPYATIVTTEFAATSGLIQAAGNFQISNLPDFSNIIEAGTGMNVYFGTQALSRGEPYYARAQHKAESGEMSAWSYPSRFTVKNLYRKQRIGLVLVDEANWIFQRVDSQYLPVDVDGDYWMTNAIWAGWEASLNKDASGNIGYTIVDGQSMFILPSFWINSGRVPAGPYKGKRFWMIDPTTPTEAEQAAGWHRHACFAHPEGGWQDSLLISGYRLATSSGIAVSVSSIEAAVYLRSQWTTYIDRRNTDVSDPLKRGWKLMPYYASEAIKLLGLIEYGSTQSFYNGTIFKSLPYRGCRIWLNTSYGTTLGGLNNQSAMMPGFGQMVTLPKAILGTQLTVSGGGYKKIAKLYSTDDGVSPSLCFNDYMIPLPDETYYTDAPDRTVAPCSVMPLSVTGTTTYTASTPLTNDHAYGINGAQNGHIGIGCFGNTYIGSALDPAVIALMVKYN